MGISAAYKSPSGGAGKKGTSSAQTTDKTETCSAPKKPASDDKDTPQKKRKVDPSGSPPLSSERWQLSPRTPMPALADLKPATSTPGMMQDGISNANLFPAAPTSQQDRAFFNAVMATQNTTNMMSHPANSAATMGSYSAAMAASNNSMQYFQQGSLSPSLSASMVETVSPGMMQQSTMIQPNQFQNTSLWPSPSFDLQTQQNNGSLVPAMALEQNGLYNMQMQMPNYWGMPPSGFPIVPNSFSTMNPQQSPPDPETTEGNLEANSGDMQEKSAGKAEGFSPIFDDHQQTSTDVSSSDQNDIPEEENQTFTAVHPHPMDPPTGHSPAPPSPPSPAPPPGDPNQPVVTFRYQFLANAGESKQGSRNTTSQEQTATDYEKPKKIKVASPQRNNSKEESRSFLIACCDRASGTKDWKKKRKWRLICS